MPDRKVNILLVDDREARLLSYEAVLADLDENLVRAESGTEALRLLMEQDFAVILLDVNMPGMDGFETAALIHQHPRFEKTPIIFVTAVNTSDLDRLQGYKLGAIDYVAVPVIPEVLRSKVAVLVELHRKRRGLERINRGLVGENAELVQANLALQTEKAAELERLNRNLEQVNRELAQANQTLQLEIAERRRAEARLHEDDRRKDEFLATLAHELRNPLAPLQNSLHILRLVESDPLRREQAHGVMERQLRNMVRLVDDLLDVSRITRSRLELRRETVPLNAVLAAAVEATRPLIESYEHGLEIELAAETLILDADPHRLAQVFGNLLNNACKYTERGGHLRLSARQEQGQARISVSDDGIGIAAEMLEQVFELFAQVDTSLERSRGGLGIGLTLVRRLVEMHGGRIEALSGGLGRGSAFVVWLPIAAIEQPAAEPAPAALCATPAPRRRILVVDDNRDAADTLAMSLGMFGHEVRVAYDPAQALELAEQWRPHLAFLDVGLPKLNGFDLARRIRSLPWGREPVLIALTGWGKEEDRRRSREAGFNHHLVKPASLDEIQRVCLLGTELAAR